MIDAGTSSATPYTALRPLSACAAGAGLLTLGVLQFLGAVWDAIPIPAREELLVATRVAFLGFLFTLAALVLAWLAQGAGRIWLSLTTVFGLLSFAGSAFLVGRGVSRALAAAMPAAAARPPDEVAVFLALAACGMIALIVALPVLAFVRAVKRPRP